MACVYNNNVTCVTDIGTFYVEDVRRQNKSLTLTPRRHGFYARNIARYNKSSETLHLAVMRSSNFLHLAGSDTVTKTPTHLSHIRHNFLSWLDFTSCANIYFLTLNVTA